MSMKSQPYAFHPVANIFPLMEGEAFAQLVSDIQEHGLREPIWLYEEQIIDGRNRYRACQEAGIEPEFREWDGTGSLVAFVVSLNLHRRHLNESQRALVAARIANLQRGGDRKSDQSPNWDFDAVTQTAAGDLLNVGRQSVIRAKKVLDEGIKDLVDAVERGEIAVSVASDLANLSDDKQRHLLYLSKAEMRQALKEHQAQKSEERRADRMEKFKGIGDAPRYLLMASVHSRSFMLIRPGATSTPRPKAEPLRISIPPSH